MEPAKIIICRHAESIEDVDNTIYRSLSDLEIPLTRDGVRQAELFVGVLTRLLRRKGTVRFYTSPGVRNMQTLKAVLPRLPDSLNIQIKMDHLIVKQDWGEITPENRVGIEAERYKTGVLRYSFPTGENAASLMRRLTTFVEKILRIQRETGHDIVVFSHGFEFRVLLMIILGWDEDLFESFGNLKNCEYRVLTRSESGLYELNKSLRKHGLPVTRKLGER